MLRSRGRVINPTMKTTVTKTVRVDACPQPQTRAEIRLLVKGGYCGEDTEIDESTL